MPGLGPLCRTLCSEWPSGIQCSLIQDVCSPCQCVCVCAWPCKTGCVSLRYHCQVTNSHTVRLIPKFPVALPINISQGWESKLPSVKESSQQGESVRQQTINCVLKVRGQWNSAKEERQGWDASSGRFLLFILYFCLNSYNKHYYFFNP